MIATVEACAFTEMIDKSMQEASQKHQIPPENPRLSIEYILHMVQNMPSFNTKNLGQVKIKW